jgi:hypothetical protein
MNGETIPSVGNGGGDAGRPPYAARSALDARIAASANIAGQADDGSLVTKCGQVAL